MTSSQSGQHQGGPAAVGYYFAESENGDHIDDPSEGALFMQIGDLNGTDNNSIVIKPDVHPAWFASVADLEQGVNVRRGPTHHEHDVTVEINGDWISGDLTRWLAARTS